MKGVQCYELFGGIALKNHTFSFIAMALVLLHKLFLITSSVGHCLYYILPMVTVCITFFKYLQFMLHFSNGYCLYYIPPNVTVCITFFHWS